MATEDLGVGMTDAQLNAYREFKSTGGTWDEYQRMAPDYEHEIANALEAVFGPNHNRLRRIVLVALAMGGVLLAIAFFAPFFQ